MNNGEARTTEPSFGALSCPNGYRLPTSNEWSRVSSCVTNKVSTTMDVITAVGGCNCDSIATGGLSERRYCNYPSAETIRLGRQCGDTKHLHVCVRSELTTLSTSPSSFGIDRSTVLEADTDGCRLGGVRRIEIGKGGRTATVDRSAKGHSRPM